MKLSVEARLVVAFSVAAAIVVGMALYTYRYLEATVEAGKRVHRSQLVLKNINEAQSDVRNAVRASREYLLLGDATYLDIIRASSEEAERDLQEIAELTADNPGQQKRIAEWKEHAATRLAFLQETTQVYKEKGFDAARERIRTRHGEAEMVAAERIGDEMEAAEQSQLRQDEQIARARYERLRQLIALVVLSIVFLLGWTLLRTKRDLAEQERTRNQIQDAAARMRGLLEAAPVGVLGVNEEGLIVLANAMAAKVFGYEPAELLRQPLEMLLPAALRGFHKVHRAGYAQNARMRRMGVKGQLLRGQRKDGTEFHSEVGLSSISTSEGPLYMAIVQDITERIRMEEDLRQAKEGLEQRVEQRTAELHRANQSLMQQMLENQRTLEALRGSQQRISLHLQQTPLGAIEWDAEGRVTEWNPAAEKIFGFSREEMLGKPSAALLPPTLHEAVSKIHKEMIDHRRTTLSNNVNITKSGRSIFCEWHNTPLENAQGQVMGIASLVSDVTEYKKLEDQFRQSQKMEAVGQLAGGVAHDFNNLLNVILGYSDILLDDLPGGDPQRLKIEQIKNAGQRATMLTKQLLAFSRKQVLEPRVLSLNAVLLGMDHMLRRVINESIEMRTYGQPALGSVKVDPGQIEQVILNLVINARDAMPGGGRLTLETTNVTLDEAYCQQHAEAAPGEYVVLGVTDTGIGMDPATQAHIFEPFFTTKDQGKGTGLGLSTVYGIVKQSNGFIGLYSEPGKGTTFKIYFPRVNESPSPVLGSAATSGRKAEPQGQGVLLLAEDDEALRLLSYQFLTAKDYTVLPAASGTEALYIAERHRGPIELLITDVVLPGLNGPALAAKLTELRPQTRCLYVSGYTENAIVHGGTLDAGVEFLNKPYKMADLAEKIREILVRSRA